MSPGFYHYMNVAMALRRSQTIAAIVIGSLLGITIGVGTFTFVYARGASYLTNDPRACANCHIMNEQYDGWVKSSHRQAAVCNDCHAPADFFGKYWTKALNGYHHSTAFTTGRFHEPILITEHNLDVAERSCRRCHEGIVHAMGGTPESLRCTRCHADVGH